MSEQFDASAQQQTVQNSRFPNYFKNQNGATNPSPNTNHVKGSNKNTQDLAGQSQYNKYIEGKLPQNQGNGVIKASGGKSSMGSNRMQA